MNTDQDWIVRSPSAGCIPGALGPGFWGRDSGAPGITSGCAGSRLRRARAVGFTAQSLKGKRRLGPNHLWMNPQAACFIGVQQLFSVSIGVRQFCFSKVKPVVSLLSVFLCVLCGNSVSSVFPG